MTNTIGRVQRCLDDDISIITSKCSEVNIVLPAKSEQVWLCTHATTVQTR